MSIKIKCIRGGEAVVSFDPNNSVLELKALVVVALSVPESQQKLIYKGRMLDDSKMLSEYSIKPGETVILMASSTPIVPEKPAEEHVIQPAPVVPVAHEQDESVEPHGRKGTFDFLIGNPEFEVITQTIRSNPRAFESFIVQLEHQNPELFDLIANNKKEFIELIRGRETKGDQVELSQEEFKDVKDLMALGFSAQDSLEAYLSCGKNKETAANLLFSSFN